MRDGKKLPDGWAIGPDGEPTNDPATAQGAQLPFGGVKGSNIAMMVELLAGPLVGDFLSFESGEHDKANTGAPRGGEQIIAIDPLSCVENGNRAAQLAHGEKLFERLLTQDGVRLPSGRRYEARERTAVDGVFVPKSLYESIQSYITGDAIKSRNAYEGDHLTHKTV